MAPDNYTATAFDAKRQADGWTRIREFTSVAKLAEFLASPAASWAKGPRAEPRLLREVLPQANAFANAIGQDAQRLLVAIDRAGRQWFVSLLNIKAATVTAWSFPIDAADPLMCLERMAELAHGGRAGCTLRFVPQEDQAFMWKAPLVHPMQVRENVFQRLVHAAARRPGETDPQAAQSEALGRYFTENASGPAPMAGAPHPEASEPRWAAVRMNHLIDTFYLFRLLVRYQVESAKPIEEALRVDLSSGLTKLMHNGDPARMGWLSTWLTAKIADLGKRMEAFNSPGQRRVIFFLKGGRALNYFLGTPEKGENDWDTQVVIDPTLPADDWYALLSKVHDALLAALQQYNAEFTALVARNAASFDAYLQQNAGPQATEDEEIDENEVSDIGSRSTHASCKAELIDIGLPRRDSPSALEEWSRLSPDGALLNMGGVIVPHRPYYVNEYLMMVRQAFVPNADVYKAPKRIKRFGLLLQTADPTHTQAAEARRLLALPKTVAAIGAVKRAPREELFRTIAAEFAEAYSLLQDSDLAGIFNGWAAAMIADPPPLADALAQALTAAGLDGDQRSLAADVGIAHILSERMIRHWELRSAFILDRAAFFDGLLLKLRTRIEPLLAETGAQFAVTDSYAARLHATQLRVAGEGFEPVRRILVQLQCPAGQRESAIKELVRDATLKVVREAGRLEPIPLDQDKDPKDRSLSFRWSEEVAFADGLRYRPVVLKIRAAAQPGATLPVLATIRGLPVLDMRFLVADCLRRSAKIDETGVRTVLANASAAILEMMSQFDITDAHAIDTDDDDDDDEDAVLSEAESAAIRGAEASLPARAPRGRIA